MLLMAFMAPWAVGQTTLLSENFNSMTSISTSYSATDWYAYKANSANNWELDGSNGTSSSKCAKYKWNSSYAANCYLVSAPFNVSATMTKLNVSLQEKVASSTYAERFEVFFVKASEVTDNASITTATPYTAIASATYSNTSYAEETGYVTSTDLRDQSVRVVVHCTSTKDYHTLYIDDITVTCELQISGPALSVADGATTIASGYNYSFGVATSGTTHNFTLSNPGTEATPFSIDHSSSFGVSPTSGSIPAGESVTLTVTMPEATGSDVITISSTATTIADFEINVSGTIRDLTKLYVNDFSSLPEDWTTTGTWYYSATNGAYNTSYYLSSNTRLITPQLIIAAGEKFFVEAKGYSTSNTIYQHLQMQYSADGTTWTNFDSEPTLDPSNWNTFEFTGVPAGNYYIAMNASQADIRMFYGGQLPAKPKNVQAKDITNNSATITWDAFGSETAWQVSYSTTSGNPDNGTKVNATSTSKEITGLSAITTYYVSVRIDNGGGNYGLWSNEINFQTECGPIDLPYSNINFDNETAGDVPQCFSRLNAGTGSYPQVYNSSTYAHSGSKSINFYYSSYLENANQMLILPEISSSVNLTQYQLTFWARTSSTSYLNQPFEIGVMTDKTDASTFSQVGTITVPDNTYREMTPVSFAEYTGNGKYIAIKFSTSTNYGTVYIDDLSVELIPACSKPGDITTANITGRSADLTFDSEATLWQVAYSTTNNFDPDDNTQCTYVAANENPFTLSGLNPETTYRVRVRANCGTVDEPVYSAWNNTQKTFTTTVLCEAPTALNSKNATSHSVQLYWTAGNENQDTWDVAYSETSNFTPENELGEPNAGVTIVSGIQGNHSSESPYTLTGLPLANKRYYFKVRSDCGSEDGKSSWSSQTYISTQPGNNAPTGLTASNITTTGANLAWTGSTYNDLHASYEVYYSTESTAPGATPEAGDNYITGLTTASHTLSGLTPDTQYYVWVRDNCGDDGNSSWTALTGSSFNTLPTCEVPENLTCSAHTATTATLTWDAPEGQTAWLLYYSTSADTPAPELVSGEGVVAVETTASKTLESLTAETQYYAWVRGNCTAANNGYSAWSSVCDFMPSASLNVTVNNVTSSDPNYKTNDFVPVYGYYTDQTCRSQFIIPATDLTDVQWGRIKKLTFYTSSPADATWPSTNYTFTFYVKEVDNTTFTTTTFDWNSMTEVYSGGLSISGNQMTIVFDTPYDYEDGNLLIGMNQTESGTYCPYTSWIGIKTNANTAQYAKSSSTTGINQQFIPKTTINYIPGTQPSCLVPKGLTATDPDEDITATTATLTWTERGTATVWNLRYREEGSTDEWTVKSSITKPYEITGLTGNTNYEAQVQAACNAEDEWSAVYTFTTDCGVIAIDKTHPFVEDFEGSTFPPTACWQNPYNGSNNWSYSASYNHTPSGSYSAYSSYNTVNLLMPEMNITGEHAVLTFWSYIYSTPYNKVAVAVSDNGGESFTEIWTDASITLGAWTKTEVLLDGYIGDNIIIAFQNTSSWDHAWYLDDISIDVYDKVFNKITEGGLWTEAANWAPGGEPESTQSAFINGAATITGGSLPATADNITIGKEGSITIADGGQLICNNNPTVTVQKSITAASKWGSDETYSPDHWYFIASPISGDLSTSNLITTGDNNDYDLYYFDETDTYWRNSKYATFSITQNHGYLYASQAGTTIQFSGTVQNDVTDGINVSISKENEGFNLVGNPFPFDAYVNRSYYTLDANGQTISATAVSQSNAIAPCTGIIVKAEGTENETVTFRKTTFNENAVNHGNLQMTLAQTVATRGGENMETLDNAIVSFNEGSQLGKFYFMQQNANIYIPQGNEEYAIVSAEAQGEMPVNFKAKVDGQYTLTVNTEDVEMDYLHLIDNIAGMDIDLLRTPSYTFNAKGDDYASRFRLVFSAKDINSENANDDFAFFSNGLLIITNEGEATLQVIDVTGRILSSEVINGSFSKTINAKVGVYVLRLVNGDNVKTQKIVVK